MRSSLRSIPDFRCLWGRTAGERNTPRRTGSGGTGKPGGWSVSGTGECSGMFRGLQCGCMNKARECGLWRSVIFRFCVPRYPYKLEFERFSFVSLFSICSSGNHIHLQTMENRRRTLSRENVYPQPCCHKANSIKTVLLCQGNVTQPKADNLFGVPFVQ